MFFIITTSVGFLQSCIVCKNDKKYNSEKDVVGLISIALRFNNCVI